MEDIVPRVTRGNLKKPLLESEIRNVQQIARSAAEAARLLEVSYNTYKKYAKLYGIFEDLKNPHGYGIFKGSSASSSTKSLDEIIEGKHPTYPVWKLKRRLLMSGYMEEKCSCCGFSEKRLTDHRVPLILDFIDGDKTNHKYENLRMLCFNCSFLINGNLSGPKKEFIY
jgi:hypothetical protein